MSAATSELTPVQQLAQFAVRQRGGIPEHIAHDVASRVLDVLGNCYAATSLTGPAEPHNAILRTVLRRGGIAEASIIGSPHRVPASSAALVNGTLGHALDFDDTHLPSVLHPSSSVVPAALAVGQATDASGAELLAAIAVGIEITNRLGMASYVPAMRNSVFFEKGFHATSICGTIGSAAAAGMLLGLDSAQLASAMGIAASMGAGLLEANRTGGTVKRIHCGWAAHGGIEAAEYAKEGVTGPPTVIEGRFGFLRAYLDEGYDLDTVTEGLGERWELIRTVYKPYPCNHFTHPGIDCALALRAGGLRPEDVESAVLGIAASTVRTIGEPRLDKVRPTSGYHAKFSGPYTVASALAGAGGALGIDLSDFTDEAVREPRRLELAEKIQVVADDTCTEEFPYAFSAVLRVRTTAGLDLEHRVHASRGGEGSPLTFAELQRKFAMNAGAVLTDVEVAELADRVHGLAARDSVKGLLPNE